MKSKKKTALMSLTKRFRKSKMKKRKMARKTKKKLVIMKMLLTNKMVKITISIYNQACSKRN